jgi:hypothetical protein
MIDFLALSIFLFLFEIMLQRVQRAEEESSLRYAVLDKNRMMGNVQKFNHCINLPS